MKSINIAIVIALSFMVLIKRSEQATVDVKHDPDEYINTTMLIQSKGYPAEEHNVTTPDGYILTIFRIPNPNKPTVFLQHGLLDGSHTWVMNFASQSLGFILWDAGYDVWMGNMRGRNSSISYK